MAKTTVWTLVVLPGRSFQVSPSWAIERKGTTLYLFASESSYRRGNPVHTQDFRDEWEAKGAQHLLTEALLYAQMGRESRADLRGFCFWDDPVEEVDPEPEQLPPRPRGTTLASLFAAKRRSREQSSQDTEQA